MTDDNVNDRFDRVSGAPEKKNSLPLMAFTALAFGIAGFAGYTYLGKDGNTDRTSLIPAPEETPEERRMPGAGLFGDLDIPESVEPEPQQVVDPEVEALRQQINDLRALIAQQAANAVNAPKEAKAETETEETGDQATVVVADDASDELKAMLSSQNDVLGKLAETLASGAESQERQLRQLGLRLQSLETSRPQLTQASIGGNVDLAAQQDAEEEAARRAEAQARREAELERLASPAVAVSGGGSASGGTGAGGTTSSGDKFLDRSANTIVQTAYASTLDTPNTLIPQGTFIPAVLETAINSDLPGLLKARIRNDVWSADGSTVLIKRGSTLIGEYSSDVALGQRRILVAWNRVITTDFKTIMIGSRGVDGLGQAGQGGQVDNHFAFKFEAAFFISIFSAVGGIGDLFSNAVASDAASDGGDALQGAGESVLDQYLSIPPTIYVDQGEIVNVFVSRDLRL